MIACLDVAYPGEGAVAACVVFHGWQDSEPVAVYTEALASVEAYEPGQFYRRELPCLLAVLRRVREELAAILVDGFVYLGSEDRPGLGAHLYESLGRKITVIGVAKSHFPGAQARPVCRGGSRQPLHVSTAGLDVNEAARLIQRMHGPFRIPTLLALADRLSRQNRRQEGEPR